jgi:hypothetical protein
VGNEREGLGGGGVKGWEEGGEGWEEGGEGWEDGEEGKNQAYNLITKQVYCPPRHQRKHLQRPLRLPNILFSH